MEELLPKDNETIHLPLDGPVLPREPQGFTPDQMIRCDECLRANPPTRVSCLYCAAALPLTEQSQKLRKPTLRQPEKYEPGFNCIFLPDPERYQEHESLSEAASLLKLTTDNLQAVFKSGRRLPIARTASRDEAQLVHDRLQELSIATLTLSDETLGISVDSVLRARSLSIEDDCLVVYQAGGIEPLTLLWSELRLIVSGRLVVKKVEVKERMSRRAENELLNTSQFFSDEAVFDIHSGSQDKSWRVSANSFDFSCLRDRKTLLGGENLNTLKEVIISRAHSVRVDDSYNAVRTLLDFAWPSEQETQSQGWRRERPGKYSLGAATVNSNETQFSRYSRLQRHFSLPASN